MNQPAATTSAKRPKPGARRAGAAGGHSQPMRDLERLGLALGIVFLLLRSAQGWFGNSLWLDEGYSREAIDHLRLSFSHYPGNMVLYKVFLVAWGSISIVPWWLRVPSMLASIATLCLVRGIARRVSTAACGCSSRSWSRSRSSGRLRATSCRTSAGHVRARGHR